MSNIDLNKIWNYTTAKESKDHILLKEKYDLFINGKFVKSNSRKYFNSVNPATDEIIAKISEANKEDINFGIELFEKAVANEEVLQKELNGKTPNWDSERIANLDAILIKLARAELFYFSNIPPKVTLNEYLEIAKEYSTPKSNLFINGVLDSLVKEYEKTNRMNKQGRGLL